LDGNENGLKETDSFIGPSVSVLTENKI